MRLAPGVQDYCWRLPGTTLPFSSALHPLPKEGSLPPRLPYLTLTAPQSGDKRRVGSVALSPRRLIFLQYFNCVAWPWNGGYVKWIYNYFTPFVCNLMGGGNATKFHFKQKYVAPAADWGLALICKFLQIRRMFCQQQCNSWDTAKEQLFIECIPFRLPSAQILGTLFLEKTLMYLLGIALYTHRSGALAQRSALAGFSSESWICYMTLG